MALDLDMLVASAIARQAAQPAPSTYSLADPSAAAQFLGPVPRWAPRWLPLLHVLFGLIDGFAAAGSMAAPEVELQRRLRLLDGEIDQVRLSRLAAGELADWALDLFTAVAGGDPGPLGVHAAVPGAVWSRDG